VYNICSAAKFSKETDVLSGNQASNLKHQFSYPASLAVRVIERDKFQHNEIANSFYRLEFCFSSEPESWYLELDET
jgi:hypothetical protein